MTKTVSILKKYNLKKILGNDLPLSKVRIEKDKAISTNGVAMAIVPVMTSFEESALIDPKFPTSLQKFNGENLLVFENPSFESYVKWQNAFNRVVNSQTQVEFALDSKQLRNLLDAIGADGKIFIKLKVEGERPTSILIEQANKTEQGILMLMNETKKD